MRFHARTRKKKLNGVFDDFNAAVSTAWDGAAQAIRDQGHLAAKDPFGSIAQFIKFNTDVAVAAPINFAGSLYTASTGQKDLLTYQTNAGKVVASPGTITSNLAANTAGGIVYSIFPWIKDLHSLIYAGQKSLFPGSVSSVIDNTNTGSGMQLVTPGGSTSQAGFDLTTILLIGGGAMALTYLFDDAKHKTKSKKR